MTSATFSTSPEAQQSAVLLEGYCFELGGYDARQWVSLWLESYRPCWIRDAVIEALYQGRYKSVSVRQILELWQRRGQPIRHVTHDFEAAVCREFGEVKLAPIKPTAALPTSSNAVSSVAASRSAQSATQPAAQSAASASRMTSFNRSNQWRSHQQQYAFSTPEPAIPAAAPPKIATLKPKPTATVSFNLAEIAASTPSMSAPPPHEDLVHEDQIHRDRAHKEFAQNEPLATSEASRRAEKDTAAQKVLDNKAWREFPSYTTPAYLTADRDEALQAQRQFNDSLYASARAIQPFKPALPFSAQTLRLAKQKAIAMMAEAR